MAEKVPLDPRHLLEAARLAQGTLGPAAKRDWSATASGLDWDCRTTLDHMAGAPLFHATNLAMRSRERLPNPRSGNPNASVTELIGTIEHTATILAQVALAAPPDARGFHPSGMADRQGFVALSTNELLLHTHDISAALDIAYVPPADLCDLVLRRLFPWAPRDVPPWDALLWITNRGSLPGHEPNGDNWQAFSAPLDEWDGQTIPRRRG